MSLMNKLNRIGPMILLFGTPDETAKKPEVEILPSTSTFTAWVLPPRYDFNQDQERPLMPYLE
ncbi:hypothetical protein HHI36_005609, partial [Cryptolaemus montrouzieri]